MSALTLFGVLVLAALGAAGLLVLSIALAGWIVRDYRDDKPSHPVYDWSREQS